MKKVRPWLIENIIGAGDIVLLSGRIDAAKTTVAAGWAMAVATGTPWRGCSVTRGSVLYLARPTEAGKTELESVVCLYAAAVASRLDEIPITVIRSNELDLAPHSSNGRSNRQDFFDVMEWHRRKYASPSLVVIDTVPDYFHGDLFDPDEVDKVISVVDAVSKAYNRTVVLVFDMEPGDGQVKEILVRLAKAADVHYVYRVPQSRQATSPDKNLHGTLIKAASRNKNDNNHLKADCILPKQQKAKARV
jgi:RecA-family ATPase